MVDDRHHAAGRNQLGQKSDSALRSWPTEIRIESALEAGRRLGAQALGARGAANTEHVEVRRFEQDARRFVSDLAVEAAHDTGDTDWPLRIGDHERVARQRTSDVVERFDLFPWSRTANDDPVAFQARTVEGMLRLSPLDHHVVRHIDDVVDRPDASELQAAPEPPG